MNEMRFLPSLVCCLYVILGKPRTCRGDQIEKKLIADILANYSTFERPVEDHRDPLVVFIKFTLQQIVDVDLRNQIITTNAWLDLKWNNYLWKWKKEDYGNISKTRIPFDNIWKPDILLYNSADNNFDPTTHTPIVVDHMGNCLYVPPGVFKSTCKIDVSNFPFDEQKCTLKFGVWSYNGNQVDLQLQSGDGTDVTEYTESGEWSLVKVTGKRNAHKYKCCPEKFVDVTFTVVLQRRTMFYIINLILPCILNSVLTLLTFFLPAEAAEKITLAITVLLAQIVFMLLIMETMPPTSDAIPIISKYFACSLITVCSSVGGTVLVLSFYYTSPEIDGKMSPALKKFLLRTAPKWMHMEPFAPKTYNTREENINFANNNNNRMTRVRKPSTTRNNRRAGPGRNLNHVQSKYVEVTLDSVTTLTPKLISPKRPVECLSKIVSNAFVANSRSQSIELKKQTGEKAPSSITTSKDTNDDDDENKESQFKDSYFTIEPMPNQECSNNNVKKTECTCRKQKGLSAEISCFREILQGLRKICAKLEEDDQRDQILLEWQYASRVLDKILLWFFSLFVIITTLATLFAVPHVADAFNM